MVLSAAFSIYILRSGAFSNLLILYHICAENAIVNFQFQYLKQQSVEILNQFSIQIAYHIFVKSSIIMTKRGEQYVSRIGLKKRSI